MHWDVGSDSTWRLRPLQAGNSHPKEPTVLETLGGGLRTGVRERRGRGGCKNEEFWV